ncbi:MAG: 6-bladed beta-propeller [Hyphomicrobiaceae bacterium]|nr:6-bladed beta-propeller [Hyphomicrobiaceae bacterium]
MQERIVGLGSQYYAVERPDCPCPEEELFEGISDVTVLNDAVLVLRRVIPQLLVFGLDGTFRQFVEITGMTYGHGIRALGDGSFAATDMDGHKIIVLDGNFEEVQRLDCGNRPALQAPFNHPTDCARSSDGRLHVSDGYGNSVIHIFSTDGDLIETFGGPGSDPARFSTPHAVLIDQQERVCVADRENNRVQRFTLEGAFLDEITGVYKPMALETLADGTLLCTDQTPRLSAFSPDGMLTGRCRTFGTFAHGLGVAPDGTIIIAEMLPNRVSFLRPTAN